MTSKISLFNKSIFLNNCKRFWWGSLLYFILLVLMMPVQISMSDYTYIYERINEPNFEYNLLFRSSLSALPTAMLCVVPVLVALLLCRYLHVRKQAATIHSLPVTRLSLYVTNILSGLALQCLPIVLNGMILLCYSAFGGYSAIMPMESVFSFVGLQLLFTFVLFAVPVFFGILTGNSILQVIFTYAAYLIPWGICAGCSYLLSLVLYGFQNTTQSFEPILNQLPIFQVIQAFQANIVFGWMNVLIQLAIGIGLLVLAYLFYRRRHLETAGDAISFAWLKPVFKYLVTFCACLAAVTYLSAMQGEITAVSGIVFLIAAFLAYFGSEMLMRKTFRVFHLWKGLVLFIAVIGVVSAGVGTDIFGYETYIPEASKIVSAAYGNEKMNPLYKQAGYVVEGEVQNPEVIRMITEVHRSIIDNKQVISEDPLEDAPRSRQIFRYVSYRLQNGNIVTRRYRLDEEFIKEALEPLYSNLEYKHAYFDVVRRFQNKEFSGAEVYGVTSYTVDSDISHKLYDLILEDIETLGYADVSPIDKKTLCTITFFEAMDPNNDEKMAEGVIRTAVSGAVEITPNFKKTYAYLLEQGIYDRVGVTETNVTKIEIRPSNGDVVREITDAEEIKRIVQKYRAGEFREYGYQPSEYRIRALLKDGPTATLGGIQALEDLEEK